MPAGPACVWPAPPDATVERWASSFPTYLQAVSAPDDEFCVSAAAEQAAAASRAERGDALWRTVRQQAELQAQAEPLLSTSMYSSVLAHKTLPAALAFVLANRLADTTLLAPHLQRLIERELSAPHVEHAMRTDLKALLERDPACRDLVSGLVYYKGFHAIQAHRVAHELWLRGEKEMALMLQSRVSEVLGIDTHPGACFGRGILIDHGTGCVIGETAVLGNNVSIMQGVTLGGTGKAGGDRHPKIGSGVLIGPMATVLGNITVERGAAIAAGSLILKTVPEFTMWAGVPAKQVGTLSRGTLPSVEMEVDVLGMAGSAAEQASFCDAWAEAVAAADREIAQGAEGDTASDRAGAAGAAAVSAVATSTADAIGPGSVVDVTAGHYDGSRGEVIMMLRSGKQARVRLAKYGSTVESSIDIADLQIASEAA